MYAVCKSIRCSVMLSYSVELFDIEPQPSLSVVFIQFSIILWKRQSKSANSNESLCLCECGGWVCGCIRVNECGWMCMHRVSVLLFVLLIPSSVQPYARLPCHMDFQLVSCPFRLRLVILSFRFVGKRLLVFFLRFGVFPFGWFVWRFWYRWGIRYVLRIAFE